MFGVVLGVKKSQQVFGTNSQVGLGKISWAILKSIGFFSALTPCRAGEGGWWQGCQAHNYFLQTFSLFWALWNNFDFSFIDQNKC